MPRLAVSFFVLFLLGYFGVFASDIAKEFELVTPRQATQIGAGLFGFTLLFLALGLLSLAIPTSDKKTA